MAPFSLKAEGSSVPHYFDARFLASFLLSSFDFINPVNRTPLTREDCIALDAHLRENFPSDSVQSVRDAFDLFQRNGGSAGSDATRREATAVFQHLFRFSSHSTNLDSRGRAINYNDGGLTAPRLEDLVTNKTMGHMTWLRCWNNKMPVPTQTTKHVENVIVRGVSIYRIYCFVWE